MISLGTVFWLMIAFFAMIGALRGWTKEIIATAGLILSLFTLNHFGLTLVSLLALAPDPNGSIGKQQFYALILIHLFITFFSYQGPTLGGTRLGERLRVRDRFQDKMLGMIVGAINGYLIIGTMWSFLEYQLSIGEWVRVTPGIPYPFDPTILIRPGIDSPMNFIIERLPLVLLGPYLPFIMVVVFLFVIIVMI